MTAPLNAPFPYFGGKRRAAQLVWDALGDPGGYVEPFCGSAAVLLARPRFTGRRVETLNDADGWLVNTWRAIQHAPDQVATHAHGPVTEIDYHARLAWLQERRGPDLIAWLEGDPEAHDPKAAGWWLYVAACGIGDPWDPGPWRIIDGHLRNTRELPHLGNAGQGVNRELPHLGNAGQGVNRELPHLGNAGRGVNRELPHLGDAGQGAERLTAYMRALADRLTRVRITCGDWQRVLKPSVLRATATNPAIGIFLDPPYEVGADLYAATTDSDISAQVRAWCTSANGYRIVLAGYDQDHDALLELGWTKTEGKAGSGAGYNTDPKAGRRERLWLSPECHIAQPDLFGSAS
jgi:site-specific DNA-adenine methylase